MISSRSAQLPRIRGPGGVGSARCVSVVVGELIGNSKMLWRSQGDAAGYRCPWPGTAFVVRRNPQGLLPHFAQTPLSEVTLTRIKACRASLDSQFEATNAAAYRLLCSILQAAVEEELLERAPPRIRAMTSS